MLMDGCIFCIKRASVMDNLLWLNSVNNILVLMTRSALVSGRLWLAIGMLFCASRCKVHRWVWWVRRFGWWMCNMRMGTGIELAEVTI